MKGRRGKRVREGEREGERKKRGRSDRIEKRRKKETNEGSNNDKTKSGYSIA